MLRNNDLEEDKDRGMTAFLLKFGEGMEEVSDSRLFISAFTIGASYFFGGLVVSLPLEKLLMLAVTDPPLLHL